MEGERDIEALLFEDNSNELYPSSSVRWLDCGQIDAWQHRLEGISRGFLDPEEMLIADLERPSAEGWKLGWNDEPGIQLTAAWSQITSRLMNAADQSMSLFLSRDYPTLI